MSQFKPGDIVVLKSGSPVKMHVDSVDKENGTVTCSWVGPDDVRAPVVVTDPGWKKGTFIASELKLANPF